MSSSLPGTPRSPIPPNLCGLSDPTGLFGSSGLFGTSSSPDPFVFSGTLECLDHGDHPACFGRQACATSFCCRACSTHLSRRACPTRLGCRARPTRVGRCACLTYSGHPAHPTHLGRWVRPTGLGHWACMTRLGRQARPIHLGFRANLRHQAYLTCLGCRVRLGLRDLPILVVGLVRPVLVFGFVLPVLVIQPVLVIGLVRIILVVRPILVIGHVQPVWVVELARPVFCCQASSIRMGRQVRPVCVGCLACLTCLCRQVHPACLARLVVILACRPTYGLGQIDNSIRDVQSVRLSEKNFKFHLF